MNLTLDEAIDAAAQFIQANRIDLEFTYTVVDDDGTITTTVDQDALDAYHGRLVNAITGKSTVMDEDGDSPALDAACAVPFHPTPSGVTAALDAIPTGLEYEDFSGPLDTAMLELGFTSGDLWTGTDYGATVTYGDGLHRFTVKVTIGADGCSAELGEWVDPA